MKVLDLEKVPRHQGVFPSGIISRLGGGVHSRLPTIGWKLLALLVVWSATFKR
jgi:hypothetical protein